VGSITGPIWTTERGTVDLNELVGIAGPILGVVWLAWQPRLRLLSLAATLVATAAGEVTLVLASRNPGETISWVSLVAYYPLAVLSVGGWGIILSGLASLAVGQPGVRYRVATSVAAYLILGPLTGLGLAFALVVIRSGQSSGYMFTTRPLLLAGAVGGVVAGAACLVWQLVATPSCNAREPTARG